MIDKTCWGKDSIHILQCGTPGWRYDLQFPKKQRGVELFCHPACLEPLAVLANTLDLGRRQNKYVYIVGEVFRSCHQGPSIILMTSTATKSRIHVKNSNSITQAGKKSGDKPGKDTQSEIGANIANDVDPGNHLERRRSGFWVSYHSLPFFFQAPLFTEDIQIHVTIQCL
ncbi:MAG: hypothetical protein ACYDCX_11785 [Acidithiobacillus sp.]